MPKRQSKKKKEVSSAGAEEQLWVPPAKARREEDSLAEPELFDTSKIKYRKDDKDEVVARELGITLTRPNFLIWNCKYECPGIEISGERTMHSWSCPYWKKEGRVLRDAIKELDLEII